MAQTMDRDATSAASRDDPAPERRSASETAVGHLEDLLFSGGLEPGDALPSESELSNHLGVSRLTVREAVRTMEARGLIQVSHGRRPVIAPPNAAPISDFFMAAVRRAPGGLLQLLEVRLAIEVHAAELAARHATKNDLAVLELTLDSMRRSVGDAEAFNLADVRFHEAVSAASDNRLLAFLVEGMDEPLRESRNRSLEGYQSQHRSLDGLVRDHEDIYERIAAHDPEGAADAMRQHLIATRNDLKAVAPAWPADLGGRTQP